MIKFGEYLHTFLKSNPGIDCNELIQGQMDCIDTFYANQINSSSFAYNLPFRLILMLMILVSMLINR